MRNEEAKRYTFPAQVLAKIIFNNLLLKSGEYSHALGCAALLIYCLLQGIKVNTPYFIIDVMIPDHLMIPNRNLPYGMILTRLFKYFKINLSDERTVASSIDNDHTFLKRMHVSLMFRLLLILPQLQPHLLPSLLPSVPPLKLSFHM